MTVYLDPIYAVNLVLCVIIMVLGYLGHKKTKKDAPLYIGIAFCLFGISHLMALVGMRQAFESILIVVRMLAYLIVILALSKTVFKE